MKKKDVYVVELYYGYQTICDFQNVRICRQFPVDSDVKDILGVMVHSLQENSLDICLDEGHLVLAVCDLIDCEQIERGKNRVFHVPANHKDDVLIEVSIKKERYIY